MEDYSHHRPFTGIDPVTINGIQKIIRNLREDGIAILITDHRERETLAITDRSYSKSGFGANRTRQTPYLSV